MEDLRDSAVTKARILGTASAALAEQAETNGGFVVPGILTASAVIDGGRTTLDYAGLPGERWIPAPLPPPGRPDYNSPRACKHA